MTNTPEACDQFALLCLEATRKAKRIRPPTTLRIYNGISKEVIDAAYNALAEGCTFPMLLNDEVNIPAVAKLFAVSEKEAAKYLPLGCGEFSLRISN